MAKKSQIEVAEPVAVEETPYSEAQLYKIATLKAKTDAESVKRAEVLETVSKQAADYVPELRGKLIPYTEKNGVISPAMIIAEKFKQDGEKTALIVTVMVYSPNTATPFRAELTY